MFFDKLFRSYQVITIAESTFAKALVILSYKLNNDKMFFEKLYYLVFTFTK